MDDAVVKQPPVRSLYFRLYRWASQRLYHELAWAYDLIAWVVSFGHWDTWRRQVLEHIVGNRVLELGFGTGHLLVAAAQQGLAIWGADLSWEMQRVAGRRLARRGLRAARVQARSQGLPFRDGAFHTIIATFPTPYVVDPATLNEIRRLLSVAPGSVKGRFIITGLGFRTEDARMQYLLRLVFGGTGGDVVTHYRDYAAAAGFDVTIIDDATRRVRVPVLVLERV